MKLRKLTSALVAAGALTSPWALGLGLGDITLKSSLNQPLQAEIKLLQTRELAEEEILPSLAAQEEFDRAGVERFFFLNNIEFDVELSGAGNGTLLLTTKQSIQEPFLNFLVEINWPNGRVLREYTVLLDPPVYEDDLPPPVVTPVSAPTQVIVEAQQQEAPKRNTQAVVTPSAPSDSRVSGGTFGPVSSSDTLWNIALEVRPNRSVTVQQTMMAIHGLNPNAFVAGNINKIKKGSVLRVPTLEQIQDWQQGAAVKEVAAHNQRYQKSIQPDDSGQVQLSGVDQALQSDVVAPEEARLKIVRSDESMAAAGAASGDQTGTGSELESLQNELAISQENLDKANRENEQLTAKIQALEERMAKLSRLVTLKDTQMAELQMTMSEQEELKQAMAELEAAEGSVPGAEMAEDAEAMDEAMSDDMAAEDAVAGMQDSAGEVQEPMVEEPAVDESMLEEPAVDEPMQEEPVVEEPVVAQPPVVDKPVIKFDEPTTPMPQPQQGFIDKILGNPVWLIGIGAGSLLFVILLFMLSRRSYQRENELTDVVEQEGGVVNKSSSDVADEELSSIDQELENLDLESQGFGQVSLDGDGNLEVDETITRADSYIAYGQFDNATNLLDEAINSEPSRIDLRLKMLEVYAETQDSQGFERQKQEILNLGADDVMGQISVLEQKLPGSIGDASTVKAFDSGESLVADADSDFDFSGTSDQDNDDFSYSLEDLESELASDLSGETGLGESGLNEVDVQSSDLDDLEFNLDEELGLTDSVGDELNQDDSESYELDVDLESTDLASGDGLDALDDLEMPGFDNELDASLDEPEVKETYTEVAQSDNEFDLDSGLDLENDSADLSTEEVPAVEDNVLEASADLSSDGDEFNLDSADESDSFDLDTVAETVEDGSDQEAPAATLTSDTDLDIDGDLEDLAKSLGVDSADDVDLDAELASASENGGADAAPVEEVVLDAGAESEELALDELSLDSVEDTLEAGDELALGDLDVADESVEAEMPVEDVSFAEGSDELSMDEGLSTEGVVADGQEAEPANVDDAVKSNLEEDELDFYVGADEVATKLDLARAYVDMGDIDGARDILEEVIVEGNESQKTEATDLLNGLS